MPQIYFKQNRYDIALSYVDSCKKFDKRYSEFPSMRIFLDNIDINISQKSGDYKRAYEKMNALNGFKDSLNTRNEILIASHDRAELELDNYLRKLHEEERNSRNKTIITILVVIIGLLIITLIHRRLDDFNKLLRKNHNIERIEVGNDIHDVINPALNYIKIATSTFNLSTEAERKTLEAVVNLSTRRF